jgi:predicted ATPase
MFLNRLEVRHLWSYGDDHPVVFRDFDEHFNVLIGRTGAGKSNIMRSLLWLRNNFEKLTGHEKTFALTDKELYNHGGGNSSPRQPLLRAVFRFGKADWIGALNKMPPDAPLKAYLLGEAERLAGQVEVGFEWAGSDERHCQVIRKVQPDAADWFNTWLRGQPDSDGAEKALCGAAVNEICSRLVDIPGFRRLRDEVGGAQSYYELINQIKSPRTDLQKFNDMYQRFCDLMCRIGNMTGLRIEHCEGGQDMLFTSAGRTLYASSQGDGILHLMMICIQLAKYENSGSVILIEEPETQMHPQIQRQLLQVVAENPTNQLIMTTHSPALLDTGCLKRIFHITNDGRSSSVHQVETTAESYQMLDDLGARASDILQANTVIWVEGPSDRIFLRRCLQLLDDTLREGLDYQFVCYGGSIRSHLTFDHEVEELINVMWLSRKVIMVCDSDRTHHGEKLNDSKVRLQKECEDAGGYYWVTKGREIENYLPNAVLTKAYRKLMGEGKITIKLGQFENLGEVLGRTFCAPERGQAWKVDYNNNKTRLMRHFVEDLTAADLGRYDLRQRLAQVREFIKLANG